MSRMRFHPQRHGPRSTFNRGLSEFFFQRRKAERQKQSMKQYTPEQEAATAIILEFVLVIVGFLVFGTIIALILSGGCSI